MAELARQLVEAFVRFSAAVAEETATRPDQPDQRFRELGLRFREIEIRDVKQLPGLFEECLGDLPVRVAQRADRDAAGQIEVAFPGNVVNVAADRKSKRLNSSQ